MDLYDIIFKIFKVNLLSHPNDFVKKFVKDSKKKFVIFEMHHKEKLLIQVERAYFFDQEIFNSLKKGTLKSDFIISLAIPYEGFEKNQIYKKFLLLEESLNMEKFHHKTINLISFYSVLSNKSTIVEIGSSLKKIINSFYKFDCDNPKIMYNLRYVDSLQLPR